MPRRKSPKPERRLGAYKQLDAVPSKHRLQRYRSEYEGYDVWSDFQQAKIEPSDSEHYKQTFQKTERSWKTHISDRGRHHALANPYDIELWCAKLVPDRTLMTVYKEYWVRLEEFYRWLLWHTDHPHVYNPCLMAAANHEIAKSMWWVKMGRNDDTLGGGIDE
ncbi:hypothetical protein HWV23_05955 [Natronomonas halophila]|uniref:hypothetical protein n=1 Tax=Natronomonas halophila TaxID=2747817 RepID=UPI0015B75559|nr:hypothetical protein [Natronomonas halophila]QLD85289.1 hypothetical protein HWV23_05955 [Natronomonas halophila]